MYRDEKKLFLDYQGEQDKGTFDKTDYLVSCIGENHTMARFIGVYKITGKIAAYNDNPGRDFYICEEVKSFNPIREHVVIEWGRGTQSWYQDYRKLPKEIKYIDDGIYTAKGYPYFKSYSDTMLTFKELKGIFDSNDPIWKSKLTAVNCIYLIQDRKTGRQYIGQTSNGDGIWGRWKDYAADGHGGDVDLSNLVKNDPQYAMKYFHWIILETLPVNITKPEAVERESLYKNKFLTRVFGYNSN
jgi:hypothetical protein